MHYQRWRKHGEEPALEVLIFESLEAAFVHYTERQTNGCLVWTSAVDGNGYGQVKIKGARMPAHRFAYERANGKIPPGLKIDHKCHNILCCEAEHLRLATNKQNMEHRSGPNKNSTTGVRGVVKHGDRWRAGIMHNGKTIWAGIYTTIAEAEDAVVALRNAHFTHNLKDRQVA